MAVGIVGVLRVFANVGCLNDILGIVAIIVVGVGIGVGVGVLVWSDGLMLRVVDTLRLFNLRPGLALRALRFFGVFPSRTLLGPGKFFSKFNIIR